MIEALRLTRAEAEHIHKPLTKAPFPLSSWVIDNGTSFMAIAEGVAAVQIAAARLAVALLDPLTLVDPIVPSL